MNKIINFHDTHNAGWFEKILITLKRKYHLIDIHELESYYYDGLELKNTCHITVDDGDKSFYEKMYPILKKHKVPATIFVSPQMCLDGRNFWFQEVSLFNPINLKKILLKFHRIDSKIISQFPINVILKNLNQDEIWELIYQYKKEYKIAETQSFNMNISQLIEIDREGIVAIGAHTINHPILANEDEEKSRKEIIDSLELLKLILGHEINYFAFPNGIPNLDFGQREIDTLKNSSCKLAFSTQSKNICKEDNPLCIPRFGFSFGNIFFVETKLFLGQYWETAKKIRGIRENELRIELKKNRSFSNTN